MNDVGKRLDHYLVSNLNDHSRSKIQSWIRLGCILVNNQNVKTGYSLELNDQIQISPPKFDESLIASDSVTIAVQINGKTRGTIDMEIDAKEDLIFETVMVDKNLKKYFIDNDVVRRIYIPNRLINILTSKN